MAVPFVGRKTTYTYLNMDFFIYKIYDDDKYFCHVDKCSVPEQVLTKLKKQKIYENTFGTKFRDKSTSIVLIRQIWETSLINARNFLRVYQITQWDVIEAAHAGRDEIKIQKVQEVTTYAVSNDIISKELSSKVKTKQVTKQDLKQCIDYFYNLNLHRQNNDILDQSIITEEEKFNVEVKQKELNKIKTKKDMYWCEKCSMFMLFSNYERHKKSGTHLLNSHKEKSKTPIMVD